PWPVATPLPGPEGGRAPAGDGTPLRRLTVNTAYLGVLVPPGATRVDLAFTPPGLRAGALASALCAVAVAALFLLRPGARAGAGRRRGPVLPSATLGEPPGGHR